MLQTQTKLKYAILFAISFAFLAGLSFAGGLLLNIEFAPPPVATALIDLISFVPIIFVVALILGFLEALVLIWLYGCHHRRWLWPVSLALAIILGGLASFLSLVMVWILTGVANLALTFVMIQFLNIRSSKVQQPSVQKDA